jgi:hypothetical protein
MAEVMNIKMMGVMVELSIASNIPTRRISPPIEMLLDLKRFRPDVEGPHSVHGAGTSTAHGRIMIRRQ